MAALGNPMEWEERATPMSEAFQIEPMVTIEEFDAFLNGQPDDELVLEAVGFTIALNRVYFAIDLSNVHRISHRGGD